MGKKVLIFVVFLLSIMFAIPSFAVFEIENFIIDAQIFENGDMEVLETIEYYTDETVNGLTRNIETSNQSNKRNSAEDVILQGVYVEGHSCDEVSTAEKGESGVYTNFVSSDGIDIKLYSPFSKDYKIVQYQYILKNVAVKYNDTAELFWNFIGTEWDCKINNLNININLPETAADNTIWVYGHGSDDGTFEKKENNITLRVNNISSYQPIDARILFSKDAIGDSTKTYSSNVLNKYINEEEGMAKELEAKKALFGLTVKELGFGLSVIILIIGVIIYILFDKEIKVEKIHYFRELPYELEPEVLQYIYYGKAKSNSFYIGVLNLIKLGVYKLENTVNKVGKETQKIIYNPNHTAKLKAYQQKMVQSLNGFLEEDEQNIKSLDLIRLSSKMSNSTGSGYRNYVKNLESEKESLVGKPAKAPKSVIIISIIVLIAIIAFTALVTFLVASPDEVMMTIVFMSFITFLYGIIFANVGNSLSALTFLIFHCAFFQGGLIAIMIQAGVGWLYLPYILVFILVQYVIRIKKYSKEERQIVEYTRGLKRYLKHYSMLEDKAGITENIALWEDYFIIAIALGLNTNTINYFYNYGKEQASNLGYSIKYTNSYMDFNYGMYSSFHNYAKNSYVSHSSNYSSSSGSRHSGSSGSFSGGSSSGGGRRRRRWW